MSYDHWKTTDPNDTPENDRRERIYERVEEEHPDWPSEDIWIEVEAIIRKEDQEDADAMAEDRELRREMDREEW